MPASVNFIVCCEKEAGESREQEESGQSAAAAKAEAKGSPALSPRSGEGGGTHALAGGVEVVLVAEGLGVDAGGHGVLEYPEELRPEVLCFIQSRTDQSCAKDLFVWLRVGGSGGWVG